MTLALARFVGKPSIVADETDGPATATMAFVDELKAPGSLALLFMATGLAMVSIFILPSWEMPAQWPVVILIGWITSMWLISNALRQSITREIVLCKNIRDFGESSSANSPAVITSMITPSPQSELVLLLEPNRLFGQSMYVSIYYEADRGFEVFVGEGSVTSIQGNGRLQVTVDGWEPAYESVRQKVVEKESTALSGLIVRPSATTLQHYR